MIIRKIPRRIAQKTNPNNRLALSLLHKSTCPLLKMKSLCYNITTAQQIIYWRLQCGVTMVHLISKLNGNSKTEVTKIMIKMKWWVNNYDIVTLLNGVLLFYIYINFSNHSTNLNRTFDNIKHNSDVENCLLFFQTTSLEKARPRRYLQESWDTTLTLRQTGGSLHPSQRKSWENDKKWDLGL